MGADLIAAIHKRSLKAIQAAVEAGADLDATDPDEENNTGLGLLCKSNSGVMSKTEIAAALFLIERGADVMKPNEDGQTPLHFVADSGSHEVMDALIAKGAKVVKDSFLCTPLHYSLTTHAKDTWIWDRLLALGCGIDDMNDHGETPLISAVTSHNPAATKYLLAKGADRTIKDPEGKIAEDYAKEYKNAKILKAFGVKK